ncbi:MAG: choice-of-anchor M domain-containing protein [Verrucomicrobiales bacterium]|nr:choice-of-anchor M domain-containing protein [Verrucomicrobiales bacterium]
MNSPTWSLRFWRGWFFLGLALLFGGPFMATVADSPRVLLTRQHVDLRIRYAPGTTNELFLVAHDSDGATNYASTNVLLVARAPSEIILPDGFPELGEAGSPFWILPASQDPELLYLGVSGEGLPGGTFESPLRVRLTGVRSAGDFKAWQFESDGTLKMFLDSANGLGPEDAIPVLVGGHGHYNWGFSSNGFCEVTFRVEGRLAGASTNLLAAETPFLFAVEPMPDGIPLPARLQVAGVQGNVMRVVLTGTPGFPYVISTSPDLVHWNPAGVVTAERSPVEFPVELPPDGGGWFVQAAAPSP